MINIGPTASGQHVLPGAHGSGRKLAPSVGVGLKAEHYKLILQDRPRVGFFEVHAENYMGEGGPPHRYLEAIRSLYPISLHGVGLNLGGAAPLSLAHLQRLKHLIDRYQPALFSEHLAWTAADSGFLNDLLPIPYSKAALNHICDRIDRTQGFLKIQILLENPATYLRYKDSEMPETEFLSSIARQTGCGLLLDVNNVYVSAVNHGFDAESYLRSLPTGLVQEIHLAGHFEATNSGGKPLLIDAHDSPIRDAVWSLYRQALHRFGTAPTLIEWDNNVPSWPTLAGEAVKAEEVIRMAGELEVDRSDAAILS